MLVLPSVNGYPPVRGKLPFVLAKHIGHDKVIPSRDDPETAVRTHDLVTNRGLALHSLTIPPKLIQECLSSFDRILRIRINEELIVRETQVPRWGAWLVRNRS
jgi:hypothetical protein